MLQTIDPFEQALTRACERIEAFAALLAREQSVLIGDATDETPALAAARIESLAREKQQCLTDLAALLAQSPGRPSGANDSPTIKALARRARHASAAAQRLNRANQHILAVRTHVNGARLELLANAAGRPRTYNADGRLNVFRGIPAGTSA